MFVIIFARIVSLLFRIRIPGPAEIFLVEGSMFFLHPRWPEKNEQRKRFFFFESEMMVFTSRELQYLLETCLIFQIRTPERRRNNVKRSTSRTITAALLFRMQQFSDNFR